MKNILFFTYDFPYPTNTGGKNRAYHLLKFAKSKDVKIFLFSFVREDFSIDNTERIKAIGVDRIFLFKRKTVRHPTVAVSVFNPFASVFKHLYVEKKVVEELLKTIQEEKIDVVHYESFYTALYMSDEIRKLGVRQVFGTENVEYINYKDYAKHLAPVLLKPFYFWQAEKIRREEEDLLKKADLSLAVTKTEADTIQNITNKECFVVENGVDLDYFAYRKRRAGTQKNILFVGNFTYFPNISGIKHFYFDVFKKIAEENLRLIIIGKHIKKLSFIKDKRVELVEFMKDIRDVYYNADVLVSPIQFGGGTNFKVLEAMATGVPVIGYSSRIKELGAVNGEHYLEAKDDRSFKEEILRLLSDRKLRENLSQKARVLVEERYSWGMIGKKLNHIWKSAT